MNGAGLKKARKLLAQTQQELATFLGTTQSKISRLERAGTGNVKPRYSKVVQALLRHQRSGAASSLIEYRPVVPIPTGMPGRVFVELVEPPTKGQKSVAPQVVAPEAEAATQDMPSESSPAGEPGTARAHALTRWAQRHWRKAGMGLAVASAIGCLSNPQRVGLSRQETMALALHASADAGQTSTPPSSSLHGGGAWHVLPDAISNPVPPVPAVNQERAPCDKGLLKPVMVVINGGCWIKVDMAVPCVEGFFEHQGACYTPVKKADPTPTSQTEGRSGPVIPTAQ